MKAIKPILSTICVIILFVNFTYAQNNCNNSTELFFETYSTCGLLVLENIDFEDAVSSDDLPFPDCGNYNDETKDLWFHLSVPQDLSALAFYVYNAPFPMPAMPPLLQGNPASNPGLTIYRGDCTNLEVIACYFDEADEHENGEIFFAVVENLQPGETLYLRVWDMENEPIKQFLAVSERLDFPEYSCDNPPLLENGACNILAPKGEILPPNDCGWNASDNTIYYKFIVEPADYQPYTIQANYVECFGNDSIGVMPVAPIIELQMAVYSYNGTNCEGIGGSSYSDPPNTETYFGCANGTGIVTFSENLPPGEYVLALDGFSDMSGNSLCYFDVNAGVDLSYLGDNQVDCKSIYPNPTQTFFSIKVNQYPVQISILDLNGRLLKSIEYYSGQEIDVSNLPKGIYIVSVENNSGIFNRKLIVN